MRAAFILASIIFAGPAWAGSCKHESIGSEGVTTCEDGSVTVYGRHGVRRYGQPNQGVPRYPDSAAPAWAQERRGGR